jgi:phage-related protein
MNKARELVKNIISTLRPLVTYAKNIIGNIKEAFSTGFGYIKNIISGIFDSVSKTFQKLKSFYCKVVEVPRPVMSIVENFKKGFETVMDKIVEIFTNIYLSYTAFTDKFRNFIADVKKDLTDFINSWINGINHLVNGLNQLDLHIPGVEELGIADIHWDINIPTIDNLPSLSIGTSEVLKDGLAVIHKGEAVVPAQVNPWKNNTVALNKDTQPIRIEIIERESKDQNIVINLDSRQLANVLNKRTRTDYLVRG